MSKRDERSGKQPGGKDPGGSNETADTGDGGPAAPANDNRKHRRQTLRQRNTRGQRPTKTWRERRALAREERWRRIRALCRQRKFDLAGDLDLCNQSERCESGACPICGTRLQQQLARALRRFIGTQGDGRQTVTVTLVPPEIKSDQGILFLRDHPNQMRVFKRRLTETNLEWAVGGLDFSCNESREGEHQPYWMPHLYLIGQTSDIRELRRQLKEQFPAQTGCPRPVKVQLWDGRQNALLYCLKGDFTRRVSYWGERFDPRRGQMAQCRKTTGQRLRAAQKTELLKHLHVLGLTGRIFSLRTQVHRDAKGVSIRKT